MEDSSAILCQISCLKDMLDQVNEEIESSIQITREIESEIVRCSEAEGALETREAELTKLLYTSQFELIGLATVTAESRKSVASKEQELRSLLKKRDEIQERMIHEREGFVRQCLEFQRGIDQGESEGLQSLLAEKESLEKEIDMFTKRNYASISSISTSLEEMVEDLQDSRTVGHCFPARSWRDINWMVRSRAWSVNRHRGIRAQFCTEDEGAFPEENGSFLGQRRIENR